MNISELRELYGARRSRYLTPLCGRLEDHLRELVSEYPRIDHVSVRAKGVDSFIRKAEKRVSGAPKYSDPLHEIQDQIGGRITTFYLGDVPEVQQLIERFFGSIESRRAEPESPEEFGYEGHHYILFLPKEVLPEGVGHGDLPEFFELQIKTLFQHAWSQAAHDLTYKPMEEVTDERRRLVAFTAAQAWGADRIFSDLTGEDT